MLLVVRRDYYSEIRLYLRLSTIKLRTRDGSLPFTVRRAWVECVFGTMTYSANSPSKLSEMPVFVRLCESWLGDDDSGQRSVTSV
jgi:hypothetical protein